MYPDIRRARVWQRAFLSLTLALGLQACRDAAPALHAYPPLGEASRHNLTAMTANRHDLHRPQAETPRFSARRDTVMKAYAAGRPTSSDRSVAETILVAKRAVSQ